MDTIHISVPKAMKQYVQQRVKKGGYGNTSEYLRELIRDEQREQARAELNAIIDKGMQSPTKVMTSSDWQRLHDIVKQHAVKKRKLAKV